MSFFSNLLRSIGIRKSSQAQPLSQPQKAKPLQNAEPFPRAVPQSAPQRPLSPAVGLPFNNNRGNQQLDQAKRQNTLNEMTKWLNANLAYIRDFDDLELALERDMRGDWIENPLFSEAMDLAKNAIPAETGSPQQVVEPYPDLSVEEIREFARNQSSQGLPPQITNNPNNMAIYDSIVKDLSTEENFGQEAWIDQSQNIGGIPSEELAEIFYDNYLNVEDGHENPADTEAYKRFQQLAAKFPGMDFIDVLKTRVFRGVTGGYSSSGEAKEDNRVKFFIENASWLSGLGLLPQSVQQLVDGGRLAGKGRNSKENYETIYQDIDTVTNTLASILSYDDPQVKAKVWDWVSSKLGSQAMQDKYRAMQNAVNDEGAEFQSSKDLRVDQLRNMEPENRLDEDQRATIMNAYKGDLQAMGQTLRYLGSDIRKHILDELAEKNPKFAPGGEWYSKTLASEFWPDQAASIIDSLVNSDAFSDPKKLKDLERKGKASFKIDEGGRVVMRPAQGNTWDSIDFSKMLPLDEKLNIWIDGMVNDSTDVDTDSYKAGLRDVDQLGTTKVDKNKLKTNELVRVDDPKDFKGTEYEGKTHVPYRVYLEQKLKKSKRLHAQMDQILSHIGGYLTSDEVTSKYPKNVIMAYLDLITTHKNIKQVGALMSQNSKAGDRARRELALRLVDTSDKNPHQGNPFIGKYTKQDIANMDDAQIRDMVENYIEAEIASRSNVSSKAQDYYRQLLDREDLRTANLLRRIAIIKKAVSRIYGLNKLSSSMSKFASTDYLSSMKASIREEMKQRLAAL